MSGVFGIMLKMPRSSWKNESGTTRRWLFKARSPVDVFVTECHFYSVWAKQEKVNREFLGLSALGMQEEVWAAVCMLCFCSVPRVHSLSLSLSSVTVSIILLYNTHAALRVSRFFYSMIDYKTLSEYALCIV